MVANIVLTMLINVLIQQKKLVEAIIESECLVIHDILFLNEARHANLTHDEY